VRPPITWQPHIANAKANVLADLLRAGGWWRSPTGCRMEGMRGMFWAGHRHRLVSWGHRTSVHGRV